MRKLVAFGLLMLSSAAGAAAPGPGILADRFISAWNRHDLKAFEALYTADAVWVPIAEERTEGRSAIVAEFAKIHAGTGWAMKTTIAKKDVPEVHFVTPDVANIFFHMDFIKDGIPVPGFQRAMIFVVVRQSGDWKIAAGQLTKESPPG
ncbi:MAG: hypothetical protein JWR77_734 [Rhizorhabdus sp.]|nr:hypothetical protein [Rhizorhabdus sp.]